MIRQTYRVADDHIATVYGGLYRESAKRGSVEMWTPGRVIESFRAQLDGTKGVEREIVAARIRYMLSKNPPRVQAEMLGVVGVGVEEGLSWQARYAGVKEEGAA